MAPLHVPESFSLVCADLNRGCQSLKRAVTRKLPLISHSSYKGPPVIRPSPCKQNITSNYEPPGYKPPFSIKWIDFDLVWCFQAWLKTSLWKTYFDQHWCSSFRNGIFIPLRSPPIYKNRPKPLAKSHKPRAHKRKFTVIEQDLSDK